MSQSACRTPQPDSALTSFLSVSLVRALDVSFFFPVGDAGWVGPLHAWCVAERLVERLSVIHSVLNGLDASRLLERLEELLDGPHGDAESGDRKDHAVIAEGSEPSVGNQGSLAVFSHVCQQIGTPPRRLQMGCLDFPHFLGESLKFFLIVEALWKYHIRACLCVHPGTLQRRIHSLHTPGVCPGTHNERPLRARFRCRHCTFHLLNEVRSPHQGLAIQVSASFGKHLIFHMKPRSSCLVILPHSPGHHLGLSKSCVRIRYKRKARRHGDFLDRSAERLETMHTDVRKPSSARNGST
mmetsp:Transcript_18619/g.37684  ORF Transcript_18619/g.37684 Transcript_18619/m.37684 type:complete len:297 (-) Transcript_18619:362-1252(-)